jgi:hypothetical protein
MGKTVSRPKVADLAADLSLLASGHPRHGAGELSRRHFYISAFIADKLI